MKMKIALLFGEALTDFKIKVLTPFFESKNHEIVGTLIDDRQKSQPIVSFKKHIKKGRGGYTLILGLKYLFSKFTKKDTGINTIDFMGKKGIKTILTKDPYSNEKINTIKK